MQALSSVSLNLTAFHAASPTQPPALTSPAGDKPPLIQPTPPDQPATPNLPMPARDLPTSPPHQPTPPHGQSMPPHQLPMPPHQLPTPPHRQPTPMDESPLSFDPSSETGELLIGPKFLVSTIAVAMSVIPSLNHYHQL